MFVREFGVDLTDEQIQKVDQWLDVLKTQWNISLDALKAYDRFLRFNSHSKSMLISSPIAEGNLLKRENEFATDVLLSAVLDHEGSDTISSFQSQLSALIKSLAVANHNWQLTLKTLSKLISYVVRPSYYFPALSCPWRRGLKIVDSVSSEQQHEPSNTSSEMANTHSDEVDRGLFLSQIERFGASLSRLKPEDGQEREDPRSVLQEIVDQFELGGYFWTMPFLRSSDLKSPGGLSSTASEAAIEKLIPNSEHEAKRAALKLVPSKFRAGTIFFLSIAWDQYIKSRYSKDGPKREAPRYKRSRDRIDCLFSANLKKELKIEGDNINGVPRLGTIKVPKLSRRWRNRDGGIPSVCSFKIIRRGDRYFVQLAGDVDVRHRPVRNGSESKTIGIDLGLIYAHQQSDGIRSPAFSKAELELESKKSALQAELDSKINQRLILWLHHPDTTFEKAAQIIRISRETWGKMLKCKTIGEVGTIIGGNRDRRFQKLRHSLPKSKRELKIRKQITEIDYRLRMTRKCRDNKLTTQIARNYAYVAIENGLQALELRLRPDPIKNESGGYDPNGASRQSALNKQLKSLSPGRKLQLLSAKMTRYQRTYCLLDGAHTTTECPVCGRLNSPSLRFDQHGDRLYSCQCGYRRDQDWSAAITIELRAFFYQYWVTEEARRQECEKEGTEFIPGDPIPLSDSAKSVMMLSERYAAQHPERERPSWVTGVVNTDPDNDFRNLPAESGNEGNSAVERVTNNSGSGRRKNSRKTQPKLSPASSANRIRALEFIRGTG